MGFAAPRHSRVDAALARSPRSGQIAWIVLFVLLVGVMMGLRVPLIASRGFNPDELEHMHFAWRSSSELPYRDYFDHHTPALQYLLRPVFSGLAVETRGDDAVAVLVRARWAMWTCALLSILLTAAIGLVWRGMSVAATAAGLLSCSWVFILRGHEIRPDVPATAPIAAFAFVYGQTPCRGDIAFETLQLVPRSLQP